MSETEFRAYELFEKGVAGSRLFVNDPKGDELVEIVTFEMDGSKHHSPNRITNCCGRNADRPCRKCGGFMHFQGVWGGYYYECEDCHETA